MKKIKKRKNKEEEKQKIRKSFREGLYSGILRSLQVWTREASKLPRHQLNTQYVRQIKVLGMKDTSPLINLVKLRAEDFNKAP